GDVKVDGTNATATVSDQSLIVHLPSTLAVDGTADVSVGYHALFNTNPSGHRYLFMKYHKVITAYRWIPWLSKPQQFDGAPERESWVTGSSAHVNVSLTSDAALKFATTGARTAVNG